MHRPLSRRTVLRGLGTALALPWLEAMTPLQRVGGRLMAAEPLRPLRHAFVFFPNGTHHDEWAPTGEGTEVALSPLLAPLERHKGSITFLRGLTHRNARALGDGPGDHARSAAAWLTGAHPFKTPGTDIRCGMSIDQRLAELNGRQSFFPSIQLGIEHGRRSGQCDSGYACAYSNHISWADPYTPLTPEVSPRQFLDRLFLRGPASETERARAERLARRRSILDFVQEDVRRLEGRLGVRDRRKVDAYLSAVRDLERRIEQSERAVALEAEGSGLGIPEQAPNSYDEHVSLQSELMILAFRLDLTRVATFMLANEGSNRSYPFLDVNEGHHSLSHHRGDERKIDEIRRINLYQSEILARLIDRFAETEEEGVPLLDSSLILWGTAIRDGNRHDHHDLPMLLAGRGGGRVAPGRIVHTPKETPASNLFLRMIEWSGGGDAAFGDSTGALAL